MAIVIIGELSEQAIVTARIETSLGTVMVMAEVLPEARSLTLRGLHIYGEDVGAHDLRVAGLRRMVQEVMEELNVDEIVVEGSIRTTGSGPGRTPRPLRFARKVSPQQ